MSFDFSTLVTDLGQSDLDALDRVTNINQFATSTVLVTKIEYTYNGAFRGNYEGRAGV